MSAAVHLQGLDCAVCCYGIPDHRFASPSRVAIPIQLHFGEADTIPGFSDTRAQAGLGQTEDEERHEEAGEKRHGGCLFGSRAVLISLAGRLLAPTESHLLAGKVVHEFYRYPNVGHAFCHPSHTEPEEVAAANKVRERAVAFFQAKLA